MESKVRITAEVHQYQFESLDFMENVLAKKIHKAEDKHIKALILSVYPDAELNSIDEILNFCKRENLSITKQTDIRNFKNHKDLFIRNKVLIVADVHIKLFKGDKLIAQT